jgi:hypothetical protein
MISIFSFFFISSKFLSLLIIGVSALRSGGIALSIIDIKHKNKKYIYILTVFIFEIFSLFLLLYGRWELGVLISIIGIISVYSNILLELKQFNLRCFYESMVTI